MFDLVTKKKPVIVTQLNFFPDTNAESSVSVFYRKDTFMGSESNPAAGWSLATKVDMRLRNKELARVRLPTPIEIPPNNKYSFIHDGVDVRYRGKGDVVIETNNA